MAMRFRTHIRVTHAVADEMSTIKCPCLCDSLRDSLSWPWDAEKQKKLFRVWNTSCWVCEAQAVPAVPALPKRLHSERVDV